MTARRGSLRYKIVRLARAPRSTARSRRWRMARLWATIAGRSLIVLTALFVSGTVLSQIWRVGAQNIRLHDQLGQVASQNRALQASNEKLTTRVGRLNDPEYLVPLIHEQLGLTKPNEVFIEVTHGAAAPPPAHP